MLCVQKLMQHASGQLNMGNSQNSAELRRKDAEANESGDEDFEKLPLALRITLCSPLLVWCRFSEIWSPRFCLDVECETAGIPVIEPYSATPAYEDFMVVYDAMKERGGSHTHCRQTDTSCGVSPQT